VLSGQPRVRRAPRCVSNEAEDAVFLASSYGLTADWWQEDVLETWLGRRRYGRWAAATCGLAVPRQNGKNAVIEIRELFGMVALGEKFLHTAHEVKTARKAFVRIASFFENELEYPELAALVKEIRKTNGQEAVILTNGGSVEFIARSRGSGRGFTVDVLVCDEAQELTDEELEALLFTISAAPLGNPQIILTGTPPKPGKAQGEVFRGIRTAGEAGKDPRLAWTDFGAADGPLPDVTDRTLWFEHNPALGDRLNVAEVERELLLMSKNPEGFARERFGWWGDPDAAAADERIIPVEKWVACADPDSTVTGAICVGVEVAQDRSSSCIGVAGDREDSLPGIGLAAQQAGTAWVVDHVAGMKERNVVAAVALDPASPAGSLIPEFEAAGIEILTPTGRQVAQACGGLYDAVMTAALRHRATESLTTAALAATKYKIGDSWRWDRYGDDVSPLYAVTLAFHALQAIPDYDVDESFY
jgi:hypothetical protein